MAGRTRVEIQPIKAGLVKLRNLDPQRHPEAASAAISEMMDLVLQTARREELSGPRPRELDQVTGELYRSLGSDESRLPAVGTFGSPEVFAPVHEFGRGGRLSFLGPALDKALPKFAAIYERHWLRSFDR